MLGTTWTWTARTLDVFLEFKPRSTPPSVLNSQSSILRFMRDVFSFFFYFAFFRPLLKDKLRPQNRQDDRLSLFVSIPIIQNNTISVWKKRVLCGGKKGHSEAKWRLLLENVRAAGLITPFKDSLLCVSLFSNLNLFCLHAGGSERWDADLDVHSRCFLSASYCLSQFSFLWCSAIMSEDRAEAEWTCGAWKWVFLLPCAWKSKR